MPRSRLFIWFLKKGFPLRTIFARFTKIPLIGRVMDLMLFDNDKIIYLPKDDVIKIKIDKKVENKGDVVIPSSILEEFIEKTNYYFIMDWCICRSASSCEHYPIDLGCLFLGEAATRIDPKLGKKVTKEEALIHVRRCREAGLVHLIGRNKLDAFWLKVGPGDKLLTVCNCCECCCLWRILPHLSKKISEKVIKMPGVAVTVTDRCIGCGTCTKTCFVNAIKVMDKRAVISDACRGCGRCVTVCPQHALTITIEGKENLNESIRKIGEIIDLT
ncbi:MAG: DUF362 domain-containing protein [Promethearchaeota archaeon]